MSKWIDPVVNLASKSPLPGLHNIVAKALLQKGLTTKDAARAFLDPNIYLPSPAQDLPGLATAADRILHSLRASEPICVWGDFDVDGQTSTTVLVQTLRALGADVRYHIPVRKNESHGVNKANLEPIINNGARLIITCDTGIGANEPVEYARSRGVDFVITDHHDLPAELPNAISVVNPKLLPSSHPLATLAGVGVAYKLAEELIEQAQPDNFLASSLLDLTAMGQVADLALLRGDSRYLVQKGLVALRNTQRLGLRTLLELAEVTPAHLTEEHIGFMLGPRLNALGRLGDANPIVEFLTTSDPVRVHVLATQLEGLNTQRKLLCDQVYRAAEAQLREKPELLIQPVIVLSHPLWPGGVVGIVASQLVERYHKPAILLTAPNGEAARGSARSIPGLNITEAISAQEDILLGFGGHPMAAGLALVAEKLPEFRHRLWETVNKMLGDRILDETTFKIDAWMNLSEANLDLAEQLESLSPFGPGNEKPILASRGLHLKSSTSVGKNKEHLKLTIQDDQKVLQQVLWWNGGLDELPSGKFDLAYTLRATNWRGERQAQLEFVDFRVVETEKLVIKTKPLEILDLRTCEDPVKRLRIEARQADCQCWAEGIEKKRVDGKDRNELIPSSTLILWSTPPTGDELKATLQAVQPQKLIIFGIDPAADEPKAFLERLAGLVKYAIKNKSGLTGYVELAAATAQTVTSVRLGLMWLSSQGQLTIQNQTSNNLLLSVGGTVDKADTGLLFSQIMTVLNETAAYRKQFQKQSGFVLD